jgi:hypothetical protein
MALPNTGDHNDRDDCMQMGGLGWVHVEEGDRMESPTGCCSGAASSLLNALMPLVQGEVVNSAVKIELHSVLNAFQHSPDYGVHVCESFRDPRKHGMDEYWSEVELEAFSIDELHRLVGGVQRQPVDLSDRARARLHQFARLLERLSKRIDRIVLNKDCL